MMLVNVKLNESGYKKITFQCGKAKTKLAILAFLYGGNFMKNSTDSIIFVHSHCLHSGATNIKEKIIFAFTFVLI